MKKFVVLSLFGLLIIAFSATAYAQTGAVVTKFAHVLAENHANHTSYLFFANRVKEMTKGKLIINIYPSSQLGNEREYVEFLQTGQIEFGRAHTAVMGGFIPQFQVFDIPYIFKDKQQMFKAADGELGRVLLKTLADKLQIKGLGFFDDGTRCLYNSRRPIYTPADFKGLKVRTMENQLMIKTFNMLGAAAAPLPFGEVYSGLQQGVIDASEGPVQGYWVMKHNEVAKYFSYTDTFMGPALPMVGLKWFNAQSKEFQQGIEQAAREMIVKERELMAEQEKVATDDLKSKGVLFNAVKDKTAFMKIVEPIHKEFESRLGKDLLDLARNPK
jgi:tripartite ATP-independent transporter DctP family solute receptor